MAAKKNFVLDTNVILHDPKSIFSFQENDIWLPIVVLEELDHFKKGSDQLSYNARDFARVMDKLTDVPGFFTKGVSLGDGLGRLHVVNRYDYPESVAHAFIDKIPDHRIIATADTVAKQYPSMVTILVTKDLNMRMKARALGLTAEDYYTDKVSDAAVYNRDNQEYDDVDPSLIDALYKQEQGVDVDQFPFAKELVANDCFILKSGRSSALCRFNPLTHTVVKVNKEPRYGISARNAEQAFALDLLTNPEIQLVTVSGKAGTGKTLLALAAALSQADNYKQILLARPIVALSNKDLGFLPGDEKQKISPYMQPLFDNLNFIKHQFPMGASEVRAMDEMQKSGQLVIEALAYIRGRTLSDTYCIIDEAQNLTPNEVKTIITRAGEGTKVVFTGDVGQIDTPYLDAHSNGLVYLAERMKGQSMVAHINLLKGERSLLSELAGSLL